MDDWTLGNNRWVGLGVWKPAGRASEPAGRAPEPAGRASEPAGRASEPAGRASEPAERASEPAGRASEPAGGTEKKRKIKNVVFQVYGGSIGHLPLRDRCQKNWENYKGRL